MQIATRTPRPSPPLRSRTHAQTHRYGRGRERVVETVFHHFRKKLGLKELESDELSIRRTTSAIQESARKDNLDRTWQV